MNKSKSFENELNYIKNERIKDNAVRIIDCLPDYFFEIPASSSGRYHPDYALGEGGLVRHTKAAVKIANELINNNKTIGDSFNDDEKDLIIVALLIHDGLKLGLEKNDYTLFEHPLLIADYVLKINDLNFTDAEVKKIIGMLKSHMGQWNKNKEGNEVLPIPKNNLEKFVHLCDFLASRKFIEIKNLD